MQFSTITTILSMAAAITASRLKQRSGFHVAVLFNQTYFGGNEVANTQNYGCDPTCYDFEDARSLFLYQENLGNPVPTIDYFSGKGCTGQKGHAELGVNENSHAFPTLNPAVAKSARFLFLC